MKNFTELNHPFADPSIRMADALKKRRYVHNPFRPSGVGHLASRVEELVGTCADSSGVALSDVAEVSLALVDFLDRTWLPWSPSQVKAAHDASYMLTLKQGAREPTSFSEVAEAVFRLATLLRARRVIESSNPAKVSRLREHQPSDATANPHPGRPTRFFLDDFVDAALDVVVLSRLCPESRRQVRLHHPSLHERAARVLLSATAVPEVTPAVRTMVTGNRPRSRAPKVRTDKPPRLVRLLDAVLRPLGVAASARGAQVGTARLDAVRALSRLMRALATHREPAYRRAFSAAVAGYRDEPQPYEVGACDLYEVRLPSARFFVTSKSARSAHVLVRLFLVSVRKRLLSAASPSERASAVASAVLAVPALRTTAYVAYSGRNLAEVLNALDHDCRQAAHDVDAGRPASVRVLSKRGLPDVPASPSGPA